jgi:hypothetical protein
MLGSPFCLVSPYGLRSQWVVFNKCLNCRVSQGSNAPSIDAPPRLGEIPSKLEHRWPFVV